MRAKVLIRGGGDIATGTIHRLFLSGYQVLVVDLPAPTVIRRTVAAAEAMYEGKMTIEGMEVERVESLKGAEQVWNRRAVPILADPSAHIVSTYKPDILVDGILAKRNMGTTQKMAPIVIGLGPGFTAGMDCDAVVETARGHRLGKVYYSGTALPNTGVPGTIAGYTSERVLYAPVSGRLTSHRAIGDPVQAGDVVLRIDDTEVRTQLTGVIRGLLRNGTSVQKGLKVADVDPRGDTTYIYEISDKARAVAGGVLEAILHMTL